MTYRVLVTTSDQRGAGTDANVYLQLHGLLGDGLQHQLLGSTTAFDRYVRHHGRRGAYKYVVAACGWLTRWSSAAVRLFTACGLRP